MKPDLSIITPCYNEGENIPLLVEKFTKALENCTYPVEVILVDNGSTDNSEKIFIKELSKYQNKNFKTVKVPVNQGYGFGITSGLKEATAEILAWTHADLQTDPLDVMKAYEIFVQSKNPENTFLKGRRKKRNLLDTFFTFGMSIITSLLLKNKLSDINAQPKMFHRKFYESLNNPPKDFSLDLYIYYSAKKKGLEIIKMPVYFNKRQYGEAKGGGSLKGKIKLIKRTFKYVKELRRSFKKGER